MYCQDTHLRDKSETQIASHLRNQLHLLPRRPATQTPRARKAPVCKLRNVLPPLPLPQAALIRRNRCLHIFAEGVLFLLKC